MAKAQNKSQNPQKPRKQSTRGFSRYKRSETSRLLRGAVDAGFTVCGLEVDPVTGKLRVLFEPKEKTSPREVARGQS